MSTDYSFLLEDGDSKKEEQKKRKVSAPAEEKKPKKEPVKKNTSLKVIKEKPKQAPVVKRSFELHESHIRGLKKLKYEADMNGEKTTLNELVRNAIDLLIENQS